MRWSSGAIEVLGNPMANTVPQVMSASVRSVRCLAHGHMYFDLPPQFAAASSLIGNNRPIVRVFRQIMLNCRQQPTDRKGFPVGGSGTANALSPVMNAPR